MTLWLIYSFSFCRNNYSESCFSCKNASVLYVSLDEITSIFRAWFTKWSWIADIDWLYIMAALEFPGEQNATMVTSPHVVELRNGQIDRYREISADHTWRKTSFWVVLDKRYLLPKSEV